VIPLHDDNPTDIQPIVTVVIIVACVLVFLWQTAQPPSMQPHMIRAYGLIPALFLEPFASGRWPSLSSEFTVFSSMFMHGGWHLIGICFICGFSATTSKTPWGMSGL